MWTKEKEMFAKQWDTTQHYSRISITGFIHYHHMLIMCRNGGILFLKQIIQSTAIIFTIYINLSY